MQCISGYKIPFEFTPTQNQIPKTPVSSIEDKLSLKKEIDQLSEKGAISECDHVEGEFISPYFLADKPNGDKRFILNLKKLNTFIKAPHFKLEDRKTLTNLMFKNAYLATIDLKDAYFLIPIDEKCRKYLRFIMEEKVYEFNCIPFGLCTAPFIFTKIMKPVIQYLRSKSLLSVVYLDDYCLLGKTKEDCLRNVQLTQNTLENLGFILNKEKCNLEPSRKIKFLGFLWNSKDMQIELTKEKRNLILEKAEKLKAKPTCKIRELAQLIGILIAACPGVEYGFLYTKNLERNKYLALIQAKSNFDKRMEISPDSLSDIKWWIKSIMFTSNPIRTLNYKIEIFTDSSLTGWGAVSKGKKVHGWWNYDQQKLHINYLELLAAFYGLKCFAKNLNSCEILLHIDNTTAIAYINRMGGIRFPKLTALCKEIWKWCEKRKLWIFATYIKSKENILADKESRKLPKETEWGLAPWAFNKIKNNFGEINIDLFASNLNAKCKEYVSWKKDPDAMAIDAFTLNWSSLRFYAFPPFSLILKLLRKIVQDGAEGIVVVPFWPTQPWFPFFKSLVVGKIMYLGPNNKLLSCPFRKNHPLSKKLILAVGKLSGNHT